VLVVILTLGGLLLLGASTLGPRSTPDPLTAATRVSPLVDIPD
jgi:hypothetical protein